LAQLLTDCAFAPSQGRTADVDPRQYLNDLLIVSEFLSRGSRHSMEQKS